MPPLNALWDSLVDGAGNFVGWLLIGFAGLLMLPAKLARSLWRRSKSNREKVNEVREELALDGDGPTRLEQHEQERAEIQRSLARQERQHDRVEALLVGDEDVPHDSVFQRLDQIEDKIDE